MNSTRGLLRLRNFRLWLLAQTVSVLGDRMFTVALAFAVLAEGGSASSVGLVLACGTLPLVGTLLVGGVVADRISRRAILIVTDVVRVGTQGTMAVLLIAGSPPLWVLAVLAAIAGAATGFFNPASTGLMPAVAPADALLKANGLRSAGRSAGEIVGPIIAGAIIAATDPGWAVGADAVTFAVSAALVTGMRGIHVPERDESPFLADLKAGWSDIISRRWVWTALLSVAIGNMMWGAWSALGPVIANDSLGGATAWGSVLAALGAGALAGSLAVTRTNPQRPMVWWAVTTLVFSAPLALLAVTAPVAPLAIGAFAAGVAMTVGNTIWESTFQRHIPAESLSRVAAYDWFASLAFYPLGLAAFGPLATTFGFAPTLWTAFGVSVATGVGLLLIPDVRNLPAFPRSKVAADARGPLEAA